MTSARSDGSVVVRLDKINDYEKMDVKQMTILNAG